MIQEKRTKERQHRQSLTALFFIETVNPLWYNRRKSEIAQRKGLRCFSVTTVCAIPLGGCAPKARLLRAGALVSVRL